MILSRVLYQEETRELAFGAIGAGYLALGDPLGAPARSILFMNLTDVTIRFTDDPLKEGFSLPSGAGYALDISSNRESDEGFVAPRGKQYYIKAGDGLPSSGRVEMTPFTSEEV